MTTFYLASETEQFALMTCLLCSLILCVFYMFASFGRNERKQNRLFNTGVLIALLLLLCMTADAFGKRTKGVSVGPILPLPMWALWCIAGAAGVLFLCQTAVMIHRKSRTLGHNSVKQALDTLPDAICYFTPSGTLKLCNLQMHRLFRILAQKDLQHFNELQQALGSCDGTSRVLRLPDEMQTYLFPDGRAWRYTASEKVDEQLKEYEISNNSVAAFVDECKENNFEDDCKILNEPATKVYRHYEEFCIRNGLNNRFSRNEFGKQLCKLLSLKTKPLRIKEEGGKVCKVYVTASG